MEWCHVPPLPLATRELINSYKSIFLLEVTEIIVCIDAGQWKKVAFQEDVSISYGAPLKSGGLQLYSRTLSTALCVGIYVYFTVSFWVF